MKPLHAGQSCSLLAAVLVLTACASSGGRHHDSGSAAALALRSGLPGTWSAGTEPEALRLAMSAELVVISGPDLAIAEPILGGVMDPLTGSGRLDLAGGWRLLVVGGRDLLPGLGPVRCVDVRGSRVGTSGFAARFWRDEDLAASRVSQGSMPSVDVSPTIPTAPESQPSANTSMPMIDADLQVTRLWMVNQLAAIAASPRTQRRELLASWDRDWRAVRLHRLQAPQSAEALRR